MEWGWVLVNIILPLAIPPMGVFLLWVGTPSAAGVAAKANFTFMNLFKDGQLAWIAAGMCAAALYEFVDALAICSDYQRHIPKSWFIVLIPLMFSILGAMFVAASGAVYGTSGLPPPAPIKAWITHYRTFVSSLIVTIASAITFYVVHFNMLPASATYNFTGVQ